MLCGTLKRARLRSNEWAHAAFLALQRERDGSGLAQGSCLCTWKALYGMKQQVRQHFSAASEQRAFSCRVAALQPWLHCHRYWQKYEQGSMKTDSTSRGEISYTAHFIFHQCGFALVLM